jgi:hypothetical protein
MVNCNLMGNSTSWFGGMPGKSLGNTCGNSKATGISSRLRAVIW